MSVLTAREVADYTSRLNALSEATRRAVAKAMKAIEYDGVADLRRKLVEVMEPFCKAATDIAASIAADFYDMAANKATGSASGAMAESMRDPDATDGAVRAIVDPVGEGKTLEDILPMLLERVDYEIKRAAGECVMRNATLDSKSSGFARIPTGSETCGFCLMLASRGFVYRTRASAGGDEFHGGALDHYHANCDCRIVPGFSGQEVEGYDPDELYWKWHDSEHAEYMRRRADDELRAWLEERETATRRRRDSKYAIDGAKGKPSFGNFNDVKDYLYAASSVSDLDRRFNDLAIMYGPTSEQMRSRSLLNVRKTALRRIESRS